MCKIVVVFGTSNCKVLKLTCMATCPPNLTHTFLIIYKTIKIKVEKKVVFPCMPKKYNSVLGAQKTILWSRSGLRDFKFLSLGKLGICPQNLITHNTYGTLRRYHFAQRGMLKFKCKGFF